MAIIKNLVKHSLKNGKKAVKNGVNGVVEGATNGEVVKNGVNGIVTPKQAYTNKQVAKRTASQTTNSRTSLSDRPYYSKEFETLPGAIRKQEQIKKTLAAKGFNYTSSPLGIKGHNQTLLAIAHNERRLGHDEFIPPAVLEKKAVEVMGEDIMYFQGRKRKIQSGGTDPEKLNKVAGQPGQRPLQVAYAETRQASKDATIKVRKEHPMTADYRQKNKLKKQLNAEATERAKALGTHIKDHQYVTVEHNARLTNNPLFNSVEEGGIGGRGNEAWNTFIQTDENARWFKDTIEDIFYGPNGIQFRGRNWYLVTDMSNLRDLKIMEVSTGKTLGYLPMPNDWTRGQDVSKFIESALQQLEDNLAEGFTMAKR